MPIPFIDKIVSAFGGPILDRNLVDTVFKEITADTTITNANIADYNRRVVHCSSADDVDLTISENIPIDYFDLLVVGNGSVRVVASGAERINGETDIRFTNLEGGRIQKVGSSYFLINDNTDPDMTDNYVDTMAFNTTSRVLTLGRTGSLGDLTETIPAGLTSLLDTVNTYTADGTQNIGINITGHLSILSSTTTGFDFLTGTVLTEDGIFAIHKQGTSTAEFDISATGYTFVGSGVTVSNAYDIDGGQTVLFYTKGNFIYPLAEIGNLTAIANHPIVLTRDTPAKTSLATLAASSLNGNSAVWILASDQISTSDDDIDNTVMIRALRGGLFDRDGNEISTTAVQKNTVKLQGGTIVRVFSDTDLRVVTAPASVAQEQMYPDIPFSGSINIEEDQGVYNSFLRRTATNAGGVTNEYIRMPDLHPSFRPSWVVPGDVFVMRHTGTATGSQRPAFRVDNTGDNIATQGFIYFADPGETIAIQAPARGIRTWQLFPVSQRSDGRSYYDPQMIMSDWYRDSDDATAVNNRVKMYNRHDLANGLVRDHIRTASHTSNPISLSFQRKNYQDDIAWIEWWTAMGFEVTPLGTDPEDIIANIPASLTWIVNNIPNGSDFQFNAPDALITISAITNDGGNSFRIELSSALPTWLAVNDTITIVNATNSGNNGTFTIDSIAGDRLLFNITNASGVNESGTGAYLEKTIYADAVLVSNDLRQTNFNLYEDAARTLPQTINTNWFDPDYDGVESVLAIGYNTDVETTPPSIGMEDDNGDFFQVLGGPRGLVHYFDNTGGEYASTRDLPFSYDEIRIKTDDVAEFFFNIHPEDLPVGQRRVYEINSNDSNDRDEVTVAVGQPGTGNAVAFDEGPDRFDVLPESGVKLAIYNDGDVSGVKLADHVHRRVESNVIYPNLTALPSLSFLLPFTEANLNPDKNEDPNGRIFDFSTANRVTMKAKGRYTFNTALRLWFVGAEPSGLMYATGILTPYTTNNQPLYPYTFSLPLYLSKNGGSGNGAYITLLANFDYTVDVDDWFEFEIQAALPTGFATTDFRIQNFTFSITADIGD